MGFRVHREDDLQWRRIGDIPLGDMRQHIDPSELEARIAFHETGDDETPQLLEMRLDPGTLVAPHSHALGEIVYVADGSIHWEGQALEAGGSLYIGPHTEYSYRAGPDGARLLNIRATTDHSFIPPA